MSLFLFLPLLFGLHSPVLSDKYHNNDKSGVQIKTLLKSTKQRDGDFLPRYPRSKPEITILKITIPPGTVLPAHTHPVINSGVMLEGVLELTDNDGIKQIFKKDDAFNEVVNKIHSGKTLGEDPVVIIVFYAGTKKLPLTILKKE